MSQIQDILEEVNQLPGVRGAVMANGDGMLVAAVLDSRYNEDVVSALTSFLLSTTQRTLRDGGVGQLTEFVLHCTHGKVLLTSVGEPFLVVLLDQFADLAACRQEISDAVRQLARLTQLN